MNWFNENRTLSLLLILIVLIAYFGIRDRSTESTTPVSVFAVKHDFQGKLPAFFEVMEFNLQQQKAYVQLLDQATECKEVAQGICSGIQEFQNFPGSISTVPYIVNGSDGHVSSFRIVLSDQLIEPNTADTYSPRFVVYVEHSFGQSIRVDETNAYERKHGQHEWKPIEDASVPNRFRRRAFEVLMLEQKA